MAKMSTDAKPGAKGESFNWSRNVMNKFLRRSFLDGVMALYETASEVRVHSVELRGSLTLTINKSEEFTIRLNESAQRMPEDNEYTSEPEDSEIRDKRGWELGCESPNCSKRMKTEVKEEVKPMPTSFRILESASPNRSPSPLDKVTTSDSAHGKAVGNQAEDDSCSSADVICSSTPRRSRSRSIDRSSSSSSRSGGDGEKDKSCSSSSRAAERSGSVERDTARRRPSSADLESSPGQSADRSAMAKDYSKPRNRDADSLEKPHTSQPSDNSSTNFIYIDDDDDDDKVKSEPVEDGASATVHGPHLDAQAGHSGSAAARLSQDGMLRGAADVVFTCVLCSELFQGQEVLGMHMEYHRHAFAHCCHTCSAGKLPLDASIRHMLTVHGPASVMERQQPVMMPPTSITSTPSQSSMSSPGLQCEECGKRFPSVQELLLHLPSHMEALRCDQCQESFPSSDALDSHRRSQHGPLLPPTEAIGLDTALPADLFCSGCQASFPTLQLFQDHLLQYHTPTEGSFDCSLCHKPFKQWAVLRQHLAVEHNALHCCILCQEAFVSELHLLDHHLMHHTLASTLASGPDADYETGQVFRCEICFKTFPTLKHCSIHKQSHGLSKPFACPTCGSSFLKKGDLTKHIRTVHSTHRPFLCVLCGKTGTRMDNMRSHVRIHKKSMPREELETYITDLRKPPLGEGDI